MGGTLSRGGERGIEAVVAWRTASRVGQGQGQVVRVMAGTMQRQHGCCEGEDVREKVKGWWFRGGWVVAVVGARLFWRRSGWFV
ncbi:hypothetical protein BVRB_3g069640 [Beta vulgaris subsp. vulgaris]|nr:hypothetical protein BVRB_3g069640 [Beta vulgaris subsp. vulgaris]